MVPQPLRIALMSSQKTWGGGEQFVWSLGRGLAERGHHIAWFADKDSTLSRKLASVGSHAFHLPSRLPNPRDLIRLRRICKSHAIQLIHANDPHAINWSGLSLLGKTSIKRVGVKHTAFPVHSSLLYNHLLDALVCVSQAVRKTCTESGVSESKTTVIHGGVEPMTINKHEARFSICEELGVSLDVPIFSAVGSLNPCKSYHRIIEAAHHLRWHLCDFRIVVCGEGSERHRLEELIRRYSLQDRVKLIGFQNRPERWVAGSDAFVHTSAAEGLSLVVIMAQMLNTPVISTDSDGLGEVVRSPYTGEELAAIIQGDDPANLARLMMESIHKTPKLIERTRAAMNSALERFTEKQMIDGFERLYLRLTRAYDSSLRDQKAA